MRSTNASYVNADLHVHWTTRGYHPSKKWSLEKIAKTTRKRLGKGGIIALVNFAQGPNTRNDRNYEQIIENTGYSFRDLGTAIHLPHEDVLIFKGEEVPTKEGHLLGIGIPANEHLTPRMSFKESIQQIRELGGIVVLDHPFYHNGAGEYVLKRARENPEFLKNIDGVETHNGSAVCIPTQAPARANAWAKHYYDTWKKEEKYKEFTQHLVEIATSDSHSPRDLGTSFIKMPRLNMIDSNSLTLSLKNALKKAEIEKTKHCWFGAYEHAGILGLLELGKKLKRKA